MLTSYLVERVRPRVFGPAAAIVALAASGGAWPGPWPLAADTVQALLLLVQFRLWDDLADRASDVIAHPDRTIVRAASIAPFVGWTIVLGAANLTIAAARSGSVLPVVALLVLNDLMAACYLFRGPRSTFGDHVLLLKYPAMALVVAGERAATHPAVLMSSLAVYLAACVYEASHDPGSPARANRALVASEVVLLLALTAAISLGGH